MWVASTQESWLRLPRLRQTKILLRLSCRRRRAQAGFQALWALVAAAAAGAVAAAGPGCHWRVPGQAPGRLRGKAACPPAACTS